MSRIPLCWTRNGCSGKKQAVPIDNDAFYPTTDPQLFYQSVEKVSTLEVKKLLPAHHKLHIQPELIGKVAAGFRKLAEEGLLQQGKGVFDFGDFQIHI